MGRRGVGFGFGEDAVATGIEHLTHLLDFYKYFILTERKKGKVVQISEGLRVFWDGGKGKEEGKGGG